jgi:uncharacterized protein YjbJ (UPF0337 family)
MIKKAHNVPFTTPSKLDHLRDLWNGKAQKLRQRFSVITDDNLLVAETHSDNALAELEHKMGKSQHTFQQILANSL